jgi:hypothetical protein
MAIRRFSTAKPGVKSNRLWDQDTEQGAIVPLISHTLQTNTNWVTISVPQTYQDLMIVATTRGSGNATTDNMVFDWNYILQYSNTQMQAGPGGATTGRATSQNGVLWLMPAATGLAGAYSHAVVHILDYANTTKLKTAIVRNSTDTTTQAWVGIRNNTAAVATLDFGGQGAILAAGSTFTIYGIKASA